MFEKVNPAHPDKIADRIAGALVDLAYKSERNPRIAVELLIGHGTCHIIAETSVQLSIDDVTAAVHSQASSMLITPKFPRMSTFPEIRVVLSAAVTTASLKVCL